VSQTIEQHPQGADHAGHQHAAGPAYAYPGYPLTYVPPPPGRFASFMMRMWARSPRWLAPAAILACFASAVAYVLVREPVDAAADTPTCLLKYTTGYDCPGCGGTRAFFFLLQANLPAAARHHLVFVFAVPFLVYAYVVWAGNRVFHLRLPQLRPTPGMVGIVLGSLGVFTVLRNLPWEPFTWFYV
jgi:hypothetical protein